MANEQPTEPRDETPNTPGRPDQQPPAGDGKGSKSAVLADLATERDKRQALEAQFTELRDGLAAALGLGGRETTPEQLTQQLTDAQAQAKQAAIELAVFRAAPEGVDAQALLDSRAFATAIADIDATKPDAITQAIDDFVTANPRFAAASTLQRIPGARDAGATGRTPTNRSMDDYIRGR